MAALVVLAGIVVGLDRAAAYVATRQLVDGVQRSQGLAERPVAVIHGFPFLTQVIGGTLGSVDLDARGVTADGVRLDSLHVHAVGVKISLGDVLNRRVREVPVRRVTGTVLLPFGELDRLIGRYVPGPAKVTISSSTGSRLTLRAELSVLGFGSGVSADVADVQVVDGRLRLVPVPGAVDALPGFVRGQARDLLTITLPVPGLPFGLRLTSARLTPQGVLADAAGTDVVFPVGS